MMPLNGKIVYLHPDFAKETSLSPGGAVVSTYEDLFARRPEQSRTNYSEWQHISGDEGTSGSLANC